MLPAVATTTRGELVHLLGRVNEDGGEAYGLHLFQGRSRFSLHQA